MSSNRPCADPRICGVQTHRPGTQCKAGYLGRGLQAGGAAAPTPLTSASSRPQGGPVEVDPDDVEDLVDQCGGDNEVYSSGNLFDQNTSEMIRDMTSDPGSKATRGKPHRQWEVTINRVRTDDGQMYLVQDYDPMAGDPDEDVAENMTLHPDEDSAREDAEDRIGQWQENWEVDPVGG